MVDIVFIIKYLHSIRNVRLKSIRTFEWYLPITARPNHFWCRNTKLLFSMATKFHQFTHLIWVYLRIKNRIDLKNSKSFQSSYVHFDNHFDVFDILLKLIWHIFIIRIFIQHVLSFLSTQPEVTETRLLNRLFH